jgi:hypothetical protein
MCLDMVLMWCFALWDSALFDVCIDVLFQFRSNFCVPDLTNLRFCLFACYLSVVSS